MLRRGTILLVVCACSVAVARARRCGAAGNAAAKWARRRAGLGATRRGGDDRSGQPDQPPSLSLGRRAPRLGLAGYDCSGSVSYVLHAAGLLESPLDSTGFMRWGGGGAGSWVRIYANHEHVFAVIAGLRWDTSMTDDGDRSGPGWSEYMRSGGGFRLRHPLGLLAAIPSAPELQPLATGGTRRFGDPCTRVQRHLRAIGIRLFWLF